ncbi:helix-turn-helix transcriptional regulator [Christensenellaceae bacterium NSJ-63]|uniref:Helix-turn-helix transcriptional regulator n=1 Tax=Guopingia tenuis TaxID=2763656 RepID=A0A926DF04_9FIRM|nr:helix-turn-helix transcriptional regulator [Guopingia tenuis]MBC8537428.1 helix-turn-helix transcriptional regulator [Guopingia tenuis]
MTTSISFKLKQLLAVKGITQKQLAELTGIRPPTISAMCNNHAKHIPVDVLDKICSVLDCQPSDIVEYVKEQ